MALEQGRFRPAGPAPKHRRPHPSSPIPSVRPVRRRLSPIFQWRKTASPPTTANSRPAADLIDGPAALFRNGCTGPRPFRRRTISARRSAAPAHRRRLMRPSRPTAVGDAPLAFRPPLASVFFLFAGSVPSPAPSRWPQALSGSPAKTVEAGATFLRLGTPAAPQPRPPGSSSAPRSRVSPIFRSASALTQAPTRALGIARPRCAWARGPRARLPSVRENFCP